MNFQKSANCKENSINTINLNLFTKKMRFFAKIVRNKGKNHIFDIFPCNINIYFSNVNKEYKLNDEAKNKF